MKAKKLGWVLTAMTMALVIFSLLAACAPGEEVLVTQLNGENKVQPIKFGHSNIYLIKTEGGYILVDAGMPDMEKELDAVFEEVGVDPETVRVVMPVRVGFDRGGTDRDAGCGDELHVRTSCRPVGVESGVITRPQTNDRQRCNYSGVILP